MYLTYIQHTKIWIAHLLTHTIYDTSMTLTQITSHCTYLEECTRSIFLWMSLTISSCLCQIHVSVMQKMSFFFEGHILHSFILFFIFLHSWARAGPTATTLQQLYLKKYLENPLLNLQKIVVWLKWSMIKTKAMAGAEKKFCFIYCGSF